MIIIENLLDSWDSCNRFSLDSTFSPLSNHSQLTQIALQKFTTLHSLPLSLHYQQTFSRKKNKKTFQLSHSLSAKIFLTITLSKDSQALNTQKTLHIPNRHHHHQPSTNWNAQTLCDAFAGEAVSIASVTAKTSLSSWTLTLDHHPPLTPFNLQPPPFLIANPFRRNSRNHNPQDPPPLSSAILFLHRQTLKAKTHFAPLTPSLFFLSE